MTIKRILVNVSGLMPEPAAIETGFLIGRLLGAHVCGLHARALPSEVLAVGYHEMGTAAYRELVANAEQRAQEAASDARRRFDAIRDRHEVAYLEAPSSAGQPTASWREVPGDSIEVVPQLGRVFDLIVAGPISGTDGGRSAAILEATLFDTGRPVVVAPGEPPRRLGESVMIAWNRSAQAARATAAALPFLHRATRVMLLSVTTGAKAGPEAAELAAYLQWHDIHAEVIEVAPDRHGVGALLLTAAKERGVDLLVMGAYSHSRLRQMILGGVTRHVLAHAAIPVLMTH
jgi:nucleotide-binding universal stress UspA family protein